MAHAMTLHRYSDIVSLSKSAAEHVARLAQQATTERGRFIVAFSGGSLPKLLCDPLTQSPLKHQIDWAAWHVFFADERCVPLNHPDSNYRLVKTHLFDHVDIPPAQIYPIDPTLSPSEMAIAYQQKLQTTFAAMSPRFDVILLGMGPDGHTASLFPNHPLLQEQHAWVASIVDSPKPPPARLTLTVPLIQQAREVLFIATGDNKAEPLRQVFSPFCNLPAALIQPTAGTTHWFVDEAAATFIGS